MKRAVRRSIFNNIHAVISKFFCELEGVTNNWSKRIQEDSIELPSAFGVYKYDRPRRKFYWGNRRKPVFRAKPKLKQSDAIYIRREGSSLHFYFRKERIHLGCLAYDNAEDRYTLFLANRLDQSRWRNKVWFLFLNLRRAIVHALTQNAINVHGGYHKLSGDDSGVVVEYGNLKVVYGLSASCIGTSADDMRKWSTKHRAKLIPIMSKEGFGQLTENKKDKELREELRVMQTFKLLNTWRTNNGH